MKAFGLRTILLSLVALSCIDTANGEDLLDTVEITIDPGVNASDPEIMSALVTEAIDNSTNNNNNPSNKAPDDSGHVSSHSEDEIFQEEPQITSTIPGDCDCSCPNKGSEAATTSPTTLESDEVPRARRKSSDDIVFFLFIVQIPFSILGIFFVYQTCRGSKKKQTSEPKNRSYISRSHASTAEAPSAV